MSSMDNANAVRAFLGRAKARVSWLAMAEGAAAGLGAAALLALAGVPARGATLQHLMIAVGCALIGALLRLVFVRVRQDRVAPLVEARATECRNVLITADELLHSQHANATVLASPRVNDLVLHRASQLVQSLDLSAIFPARSVLALLAAATVASATLTVRDSAPVRTAVALARRTISPNVARIDDVEITITAPTYAGGSRQTVRDTSRVEVLAGSRMQFDIRARADSLVVSTLGGVQRIAAAGDDRFVVSLSANADDYLALTPLINGSEPGAQRMIGVSITPDLPPRVRIVTPGRDTLLRDPNSTLSIAVESEDDLALASLRLRFTKVSGSGERFSFAEADVPLAVTRTSTRTWRATARWTLDTLKLEPGDMVVYRAIATDRRPGSAPQESDAFIAELFAIGGDAAAGFAIDPDQERYAVSQAMVVLKTERLIAQASKMPADSVLKASMELAAEQRKVRAEFVFMMGGELGDEHAHTGGDLDDLGEEAEAEAEEDILAGRLENQGRVALMRAIRSMSRASTLLNVAELTTALAAEKSAVAQLELAFSRSRIILRALAEREALDLSRRLSGDLSEARSDRRAVVAAELNPRTVALRRLLADVSGLAAKTVPRDAARSDAANLTQLAQDVLRIDPSAAAMQRISMHLTTAAEASEGVQSARRASSLDSATVALTALLRSELPASVSRSASPALRALDAARFERQRRAVAGRPNP